MASAGIRKRHTRSCPAYGNEKGRCRCQGGYEAAAYDPDGVKVRRTFPTETAAKAWRHDALARRQRGAFRAPAPTTLREAAATLIAGMRSGLVRTRSGQVYKPSAARSYEQALQSILGELGGAKLSDIRRADVQRIADELLAAGSSPSTIRNRLTPLRVICRRAIEAEELTVNPLANLRLPAVRSERARIVSPDDAARLLEALPAGHDRALWATALYAGLRRGELMALRWQDVDVASGVIRVERSYDPTSGTFGLPKSRAGVRRVPIAGVLRDVLLKLRLDADVEGFVFGRNGRPFDDSSLVERARLAWTERDELLSPITLQECRHTFASMMIAAGVNAKALSTYMGHSSITITIDRYGHLMPGNEEEAASLLDAYLTRSDTAARLAALESDGRTDGRTG